MNQLQVLYNYNLEHRERFNEKLINRDDNAIVEEIIKVIKACERDRFFTIKIQSYEVVDNPIEVHRILYENEQEYIDSKKKKKENIYKYISLKDSDIKLLIVNYYVAVKGESTTFKTIIAIPKVVNKFYFRLMGNMYSPMYQIVDGSTYNNARTKSKKHNITLKTIFGPIRIYRNFISIKDVNKHSVNMTLYVAHVFSKSINAFKFLLAKFGLMGTMQFMKLKYIFINDYNPKDDSMYTFNKNNIYISCPKDIFDSDPVTQSFIATFIKGLTKDANYNLILNKEYWECVLGQDFGNFSVEKGQSVCESLEGRYDISTRDSICLPIEEKDDIYCILRWMIREFSNLMIKDNLDISTKKVRYAEYIASLYAMKISKGIHRISDLGNRASIDDMRKALDTYPMYLINAISKSTLVNYRNNVNDMDAFSPLKVTFKGVSGIGENSKSTISDNTRQIQPEFIGRMGLDESSPSDPGLTGILCPYVQLAGTRFSDEPEPLTWENSFTELVNNYQKLKGIKEVIKFKKEITGEYDEEQEQIINDSIETFNKLVQPVYFVTCTTEKISPITFDE